MGLVLLRIVDGWNSSFGKGGTAAISPPRYKRITTKIYQGKFQLNGGQMNHKKSGRRRFLKDGAALAGLAWGTTRFASGETSGAESGETRPKDLHAYGERSRFETSARWGNNNRFGSYPKPGEPFTTGPRTPLQDSIGIITPSPLHYIVSPPGNEPPDIDPRQHRLMIHGLVERPLIFTMEELKRLPSVSRIHFLCCRANGDPSLPERKMPTGTVQATHGQTSCSEWTGVPLSLLLKEAGVQKGASWIVAEGSEQSMHIKSIPIEKAMEDVLVAYGQNGEAVRPEQGYPLRLLVPGWQGINNVKWLRRIKLVDKPYMGIRESTQYPELRPDGKARWFESVLGPYSVITRPSGGQKLPGRGFYEITGLAWSGGGAIRRVEVSADGGRTWKDAELQGPVHRKAHTRFRLGWNWNGEEALLQSRSTDELNEVQPTLAELTEIWKVPMDWYRTVPYLIGNFNAVQPWKVTRDGSVQNALFT
jgi:sulfane dehydrogenase subunit SoxC